MNTKQIDLGNKIKERREFLKIEKEMVAKYLLHCSVQYLEDIESGKVNDINAIELLCHTLFNVNNNPLLNKQ